MRLKTTSAVIVKINQLDSKVRQLDTKYREAINRDSRDSKALKELRDKQQAFRDGFVACRDLILDNE